jgi:hypothetical protein
MSQNAPGILCAHCGKLLARALPGQNIQSPPPEQLMKSGAVPVPNFGWFCSQECATRYEGASGRRMFDRNAAGEVQYYPKP